MVPDLMPEPAVPVPADTPRVGRIRQLWQDRGIAGLGAGLDGLELVAPEDWQDLAQDHLGATPSPAATGAQHRTHNWLALARMSARPTELLMVDADTGSWPVHAVRRAGTQLEFRLLAADLESFFADLQALHQLSSRPAADEEEASCGFLRAAMGRSPAADIEVWHELLEAQGRGLPAHSPCLRELLGQRRGRHFMTRIWVTRAALREQIQALAALVAATNGLEPIPAQGARAYGRQITPLAAARYVALAGRSAGEALADHLAPGLFRDRDLREVVVICHHRDGSIGLAFRGGLEAICAALEEAPVPGMWITNPRGSLRIEWADRDHLRILGSPWTRFFPWRQLALALLVGVTVTVTIRLFMVGDAVFLPSLREVLSLQGGLVPGLLTLLGAASPALLIAALVFGTMQSRPPGRRLGPGLAGCWTALVLLGVIAVILIHVLNDYAGC